jgi:hypothetical protein
MKGPFAINKYVEYIYTDSFPTEIQKNNVAQNNAERTEASRMQFITPSHGLCSICT